MQVTDVISSREWAIAGPAKKKQFKYAYKIDHTKGTEFVYGMRADLASKASAFFLNEQEEATEVTGTTVTEVRYV